MKHQWEEIEPARLMGDRRRRCKLCGVVQERATDTWYMRIVRRYWWPEDVGRSCKP